MRPFSTSNFLSRCRSHLTEMSTFKDVECFLLSWKLLALKFRESKNVCLVFLLAYWVQEYCRLQRNRKITPVKYRLNSIISFFSAVLYTQQNVKYFPCDWYSRNIRSSRLIKMRLPACSKWSILITFSILKTILHVNIKTGNSLKTNWAR
jgi:hypothetical protein